jgi:hypothetical protein
MPEKEYSLSSFPNELNITAQPPTREHPTDMSPSTLNSHTGDNTIACQASPSGTSSDRPDSSSSEKENRTRQGTATLLQRRLKSALVPLVIKNSGNIARDHLAAERTFLAYVRASSMTVATGVGK